MIRLSDDTSDLVIGVVCIIVSLVLFLGGRDGSYDAVFGGIAAVWGVGQLLDWTPDEPTDDDPSV